MTIMRRLVCSLLNRFLLAKLFYFLWLIGLLIGVCLLALSASAQNQKPAPPSWVTVPEPAPASPQLTVTLKSLGRAPLRVLVNVPIRPEKGAPSIGAMVLAIALMLSRQRSSRLSKERRRRSRRRLAHLPPQPGPVARGVRLRCHARYPAGAELHLVIRSKSEEGSAP